MKKSLVLMCIGGMLALCTPLVASESPVDPPITKTLSLKKGHDITEKTITTAPVDEPTVSTENAKANSGKWDGGGVVIISGTALLLLIILLIVLL